MDYSAHPMDQPQKHTETGTYYGNADIFGHKHYDSRRIHYVIRNGTPETAHFQKWMVSSLIRHVRITPARTFSEDSYTSSVGLLITDQRQVLAANSRKMLLI